MTDGPQESRDETYARPPAFPCLLVAEEAAPWCPCGHGEDDICLNGQIYGNCGDENCGGGCDPDAGRCRSLPGCCDSGE